MKNGEWIAKVKCGASKEQEPLMVRGDWNRSEAGRGGESGDRYHGRQSDLLILSVPNHGCISS